MTRLRFGPPGLTGGASPATSAKPGQQESGRSCLDAFFTGRELLLWGKKPALCSAGRAEVYTTGPALHPGFAGALRRDTYSPEVLAIYLFKLAYDPDQRQQDAAVALRKARRIKHFWGLTSRVSVPAKRDPD